jgi:hypothetical protein
MVVAHGSRVGMGAHRRMPRPPADGGLYPVTRKVAATSWAATRRGLRLAVAGRSWVGIPESHCWPPVVEQVTAPIRRAADGQQSVSSDRAWDMSPFAIAGFR